MKRIIQKFFKNFFTDLRLFLEKLGLYSGDDCAYENKPIGIMNIISSEYNIGMDNLTK